MQQPRLEDDSNTTRKKRLSPPPFGEKVPIITVDPGRGDDVRLIYSSVGKSSPFPNKRDRRVRGADSKSSRALQPRSPPSQRCAVPAKESKNGSRVQIAFESTKGGNTSQALKARKPRTFGGLAGVFPPRCCLCARTIASPVGSVAPKRLALANSSPTKWKQSRIAALVSLQGGGRGGGRKIIKQQQIRPKKSPRRGTRQGIRPAAG